MNVSKQFLLGVLTLGLQAGLASALEPAPVNGAAGFPSAAAVAPLGSPAGSGPSLPVGLSAVAPQLGSVDASCTNCCCASGQGGVIGGVGLYLVQPYFQDNLAYGNRGANSTTLVDVRQHVDAAPLIWLGYLTDDGWGGRRRYWYLREGTSQSAETSDGGLATAAPLGLNLPTSSSVTVTTKLEMQFLDLEGIADLKSGCWDFLFSAGLRIVRFDESYNAYNVTTLQSSHEFDGVGPTLCLETRRFLGSSGLALYGSARGSLAFGSAEQTALFGTASAQDHRDRSLPIGELEIGVEYDRQVAGVRLFAQLGFVAQDWVGAGNSSRSTSNITPTSSPSQALPLGGFAVDSDLDLLGLCLRIGINY